MGNEIKDLPAIEPLCSDLWIFFYDRFGLTLLESELNEIIDEVEKHTALKVNEKLTTLI